MIKLKPVNVNVNPDWVALNEYMDTPIKYECSRFIYGKVSRLTLLITWNISQNDKP